jgi:hypothetical protein
MEAQPAPRRQVLVHRDGVAGQAGGLQAAGVIPVVVREGAIACR